MFRRKCAKVVFRAQWLVTVGSSWEVVADSSLVQCKTRFVQIFHMFFFMKQMSYPDLALSYAVGDSGTRLPLPLLTHPLNCLRIPFVLLQWELHCSCLKPLVLSNVVQGGSLSASIQDQNSFLKNPALMNRILWSSELQSVTLITFGTCPPHPLSIERYQQRLRLYG